MSTDYRFTKEIKMEDLFDGRLEPFGVFESIDEEQSCASFRILTDGQNELGVCGDGAVNVVKRCGTNNPVVIINAITDVFDTFVCSEYDPQFWGYETEEEWLAECP